MPPCSITPPIPSADDLSPSERRLVTLLETRLLKKLDERLAVIRQAIDEALAADDDSDESDEDLDEE